MKDVIPGPSHSGLAERVIAAGVIIGFLYWAEIVVLTVILSVLLAYFLDPLVQLMERWHVPRALGSLIVLLLATAVLVGLGVLTGSRLNRFIADWPRYSAMLQNASAVVAEHLRHFMQGFLHLRPEEAGKGFGFLLAEQDSLRNLLLRGLGSLYSLIWVVAFIPFLVFFMLWEKKNVWQSTLNLFPSAQREQARSGLKELSAALRGYIVGNAIVAGILVLTSWLFFWLIGLDYAFLSALFSGLLNFVPYLEHGSVPRRGDGFDRAAHHRDQRALSGSGRASSPSQCRLRHHRVALLGVALGRHRLDPGDPHHCDDESDL
jgi:predicted PurR-regulated permease PerM